MPMSPAAVTPRQLSAEYLTVLCFAVVICRYAVVVATGVTLGPPLYNVHDIRIHILTQPIYTIAIISLVLGHWVQVIKRAVAIAREIGSRRVTLTLGTVVISIAALCHAVVQLKPVMSSFCDLMLNDNYMYVNPRDVFPPDINIETIELPAYVGQHKPKKLSTLYHLNEDAVFLCNFEVGINVDFKTIQVTTRWTINDTITINKTSSVEIRTEEDFVSGPPARNEDIEIRKYRVKNRLTIRGVNEAVRGILSCKATVFMQRKALGMIDTASEEGFRYRERLIFVPLSSTLDYVVVHYVVHLPPPATKGYISPGGLMMTRIDWYSLNEDEDIVVEHRVNGRLLERDQRTVVNELLSCWVPFTSYQTLWALLGDTVATMIFIGTVHYRKWDDRFKYNRIIDWHSMCVTGDMYGLNTWHARRVSANESASGRELVTEERPSLVHAVWVAPVYSPLLIFSVKDHWYEDFMSDCGQNDQQIHSDDCRSRNERLVSLVNWYRFVDNITVCIIMYTTFAFLSLRVVIFVAYVSTLTLRDVVKFSLKTLCVIPFVAVPGHGRLRQMVRFDYDVFLAYAEENGDIARAVTSVLTSFGLRVFDSQRDVPVTRQTTAVWDEMMGRCSSVLILASNAYFTDCYLRVQFRALYDCLLHQELPSQLLMLRVDGYQLPAFLGPIPVIDLRQKNWTQVFDWWLIATFFSPFQATHSPTITRTLTTRAVMYQALKDVGRDVLSYTRSLLRQNSVNCQLMPRDASSAAHQLWHDSDPRNVSNNDVFLSFCEDSYRDRELAGVVKTVLQRRGLSVYDTSVDLLPGQEHIQLIRSAARCRAFVVIRSSAYISNPLTCRLHLHQVHQALGSGSVPPGNVVFIHTDDHELMGSTNAMCDELERAARDSPIRHVTTQDPIASTCTSKALVPYRQHPHIKMCQTIFNAPRRVLLPCQNDQQRIAENFSLASYGEAQPNNDFTNRANEDSFQLIRRCHGVIPFQQSNKLPPNSRTTAEASKTAPSRQGATARDDSFLHDNILAAMEEKCFHLYWSDLDAACQFLQSWARMLKLKVKI